MVPWMERHFCLMRREMESLFNRFLGGWPEMFEGPPWALETEEMDKEYVVRAELPGFEPAEVEVEVRGEELRVRAEHKEAKEKEGEKESRYAEIERTMTLPPGTEKEKMEARYHNGVLEVHLPKGPEAIPRRIAVKT
jgi:HSP20 family protein